MGERAHCQRSSRDEDAGSIKLFVHEGASRAMQLDWWWQTSKKFPFRELRRVVKLFKMIGSNRFYAINETLVANFIGKKLRYAPDQVKAEKMWKVTNPSCLDVEENEDENA